MIVWAIESCHPYLHGLMDRVSGGQRFYDRALTSVHGPGPGVDHRVSAGPVPRVDLPDGKPNRPRTGRTSR